MSERTDTKFRETKFFFQNLVRESDMESPSEPEAFLFYLNAFSDRRRERQVLFRRRLGIREAEGGRCLQVHERAATCRALLLHQDHRLACIGASFSLGCCSISLRQWRQRQSGVKASTIGRH